MSQFCGSAAEFKRRSYITSAAFAERQRAMVVLATEAARASRLERCSRGFIEGSSCMYVESLVDREHFHCSIFIGRSPCGLGKSSRMQAVVRHGCALEIGAGLFGIEELGG